METFKNLLILTLLFSGLQLKAQTSQETTAKVINEKNYVFSATSASPLNVTDINNVMSKMPGYTGGGNINLNGSNYDLSVTPDSVVAYLPYYGRSFTPKLGDPNDSGIKFKSKNFTYKSTKTKKGNWTILINPKDVKDNYNLTLSVTKTGNATLTITSNSQQSISYNGNITEPKPKKDK
ncbi:hypothetical protein TH53_05985 [Pedobacter lusitanus]|uniref:DUF4251 domain-containing protein n=1 Tax=Pedobacter lusitanus TaxID=1503925 RepID=A0A0D0GU84_9SPHI|nr:DUF4251 domain-containing protein [Pedobacter lusitanus]KIO77981.1 hypothetical protein TH53_05985 [Pedobacter lusitanus]